MITEAISNIRKEEEKRGLDKTDLDNLLIAEKTIIKIMNNVILGEKIKLFDLQVQGKEKLSYDVISASLIIIDYVKKQVVKSQTSLLQNKNHK